MFDELSDITLIETPLMDSAGFLELLLRFCFNLLVVSLVGEERLLAHRPSYRSSVSKDL